MFECEWRATCFGSSRIKLTLAPLDCIPKWGSTRNHFWFSVLYKVMTNMQDMVMAAEAYRRRVFFNYERRLRLRSPPEKVPLPPCPGQCIVSQSIFDSLKNMAPEIFVSVLCVNPLVQKAHDDMGVGFTGLWIFLISETGAWAYFHDSCWFDEGSSSSVPTDRVTHSEGGLSWRREVTWGVTVPSLKVLYAVWHRWRWTHLISRVRPWIEWAKLSQICSVAWLQLLRCT